jgi:hypothetical protein
MEKKTAGGDDQARQSQNARRLRGRCIEVDQDRTASYTEWAMTAREKLRHLVDAMPEDEAAALLAEVERWAAERGGVQFSAKPRTWPPAFSGIMRSGEGDLARRTEDIVRAEFGTK